MYLSSVKEGSSSKGLLAKVQLQSKNDLCIVHSRGTKMFGVGSFG